MTRIKNEERVPPRNVAENAKRGLELRRRFKRGGTQVGIARARDLKNRRNLSEKTITRMVSYFQRHEVDKKADNFGDNEDPSNGYIAWLLWGGDEGFEWSLKMKEQQEKK